MLLPLRLYPPGWPPPSSVRGITAPLHGCEYSYCCKNTHGMNNFKKFTFFGVCASVSSAKATSCLVIFNKKQVVDHLKVTSWHSTKKIPANPRLELCTSQEPGWSVLVQCKMFLRCYMTSEVTVVRLSVRLWRRALRYGSLYQLYKEIVTVGRPIYVNLS